MDNPESSLEAQRTNLREHNLAALNEAEPPAAVAVRPKAGRAKAGLPALVWQGKPWQALQTVALLLSLVVNVVLLVVAGVLVMVAGRAFVLKDAMLSPLVNGLHDGFVAMDEAHIRTTIQVNETIQVDDTLPVVFDLPLNTNTVVTTTQPILITGATVNINGGVLVLNDAPTTILLPANTPLPVQLNLTVPVSQTVPVQLDVPINLTVPVDIPLQDTELHQPFASLRDLIAPYKNMVNDLPDSWAEALGQ